MPSRQLSPKKPYYSKEIWNQQAALTSIESPMKREPIFDRNVDHHVSKESSKNTIQR